MFHTATNFATRLGDFLDDMLLGDPERDELEWGDYEKADDVTPDTGVWEDSCLELSASLDRSHMRGHALTVDALARERRAGSVPLAPPVCPTPATAAAQRAARSGN